MSGGAFERVMGNYNDTIGSAGFSSMPEAKYYDKYIGIDSWDDFKEYHLGDATKETLKTKSRGGNAWYQDDNYSVRSSNPWMYRGSWYKGGTRAGLFFFDSSPGGSSSDSSFRVVLDAL